MLTPDDLKKLSEPFDSKTIGIKVNSFSKDKTKALLVAYVQHTDVYDRLEAVDPAWTAETTWELVRGEMVYVRVKLTVKGISRDNVGEGEDHKSATSDALKRAAMLFGVGRYLYDAEKVWVPYNEQTDKFKTFTVADFQGAIRPGQASLPVGDSKPGTHAAAASPKAAPATKPAARAPKQEEQLPSDMTRDQLGKKIMMVSQELRPPLSQADLADWVDQEFKKPMKSLTLAEMARFLGILEKELGPPLEGVLK